MWRWALLAAALAFPARGATEPPAMAAVGVLSFGNTRCSATLIAPDLVLTAGHCVLLADGSGPVEVAGTVFRTGAYPGHGSLRFRASDIVVHPLYIGADGAAGVPHDAALVRLAEPVPAEVAAPIAVTAGRLDGAATFLASYRAGRGSRARERRCPVLQEWTGVMSLSCDVRPGESGSPILVAADGRLGLVGIVSASTRTMRTETAIAARAERLVLALRAVMGPPSSP